MFFKSVQCLSGVSSGYLDEVCVPSVFGYSDIIIALFLQNRSARHMRSVSISEL